jgi:hypothetical protein
VNDECVTSHVERRLITDLHMKRFWFFALGLSILGCSVSHSLSPQYGVISLTVSNDQNMYFKREVRGLNYDVVVLSTDGDYCREPDASSDYVFANDPLPMYYKLEDGTLSLYLTSLAAVPENFQSPIRVVQHQLSPLEFEEIEQHYKERGLNLLRVEIDKRLKCK